MQWQIRIPRLRLSVSTAVIVLVLSLSALRTSAAPAVDNLTSSGGTVMHTSTTYAIFWLPTGYHFETANDGQPANATDTSYESLIKQFLGDVGGSSSYNIVTQYPDGNQVAPLNSSTFGGSVVDTTSPYRSGDGGAGSTSDPLLNTDIQAEITHAMSIQGWSAGATNLFLVFTGYGVQSCSDDTESQCSWDTYCAFHSSYQNAGQTVYYVALPAAGQNGGICEAKSGSTTYQPNNDAAADGEISLVSKDLFAAVTDAQGNGWSDSTGAEIGDKCDWSYGAVQANGSNIDINAHNYIVQQEWSNANQSCVLTYDQPLAIPISNGWNLLDIPRDNLGINSAATLIANLTQSNQLGAGTVSSVAVYASGRYVLYVPGYSSDYTIQPYQGIFVDATKKGTWTVAGTPFATPQTVSLGAGWNLIAAPYPWGGLNSQQIVEEIDPSTACSTNGVCIAQQLDTWNTQTNAYDQYTYSPGGQSPSSITTSEGLWVSMSQAETWTPQTPASS